MKKLTIFSIAILFVAALVFTLLINQKQETLIGYAVSNIFIGADQDTSTLGFVARETKDTITADYEVESTILLPSGEFTQDNYTVTIPYLGLDVTIPKPPPPETPTDGGRRREEEKRMGEVCEGSWQCSNYGECQPNGFQYRVCVVVSCEYTTEIKIPPKPSEVRPCDYKEPEEPQPEPPPPEKFEFWVRPKIDKKYKPGDPIVLHTYINNPTPNNLQNLEVEHNIDIGTELTVYVEYEGIFNVDAYTKYDNYIDHSLDGYENRIYKIHGTLYTNGQKLAESYHDLDLR